MLRTGFAAALSCSVLAGCASLPYESSDGIAIARVVERVKCELGAALSKHKQLSSWAAVMTLTLQVDHSGGVAPSVSMSGPLSPGTYGIDFSVGASTKAARTSLITLYFPVYQAMEFAEACPARVSNYLEDTLGLQVWIDRVFEAGATEGFNFDKEKAIGHTLEFTLDLTAGFTPGFTFTNWSGKGAFGVGRKGVNTLDVVMVDAAIVPMPPPAKRARPRAKLPPDTGVRPFSLPAERQPRRQLTQPQTTSSPQSTISDNTRRKLDAVMQQLLINRLPRRF